MGLCFKIVYQLFQSHDELEDKRVSVMLDFMNLKKLNRLAHIRCKKVREQTNDVRLQFKLHRACNCVNTSFVP